MHCGNVLRLASGLPGPKISGTDAVFQCCHIGTDTMRTDAQHRLSVNVGQQKPSQAHDMVLPEVDKGKRYTKAL